MSDITTLAKVKTRCSLASGDTTYDALLTFFIGEVARRFDQWTGRKLERSTGRTNVFPGDCVALTPDSYPVEQVTKWELKSDEASGWVEQSPAPTHLLYGAASVVCLAAPVGARGELLRITYDAGYVFPGGVPGPGQTSLPSWMEDAAIEQCAQLYQLRDKIGVSRVEISTGVHWSTADYVWVPWVRFALARIRRANYLGHL